ncbi:MAG: gliding motility-associated C-terminal domain-containing protein [Burkholderiales bacterium]|nr:gliding motility-associated C-terminal domain-containing protein [Flavobacterium sp.]
MKKITFVFLLIVIGTTKSGAQNDCVDAIIICGDANLSGLTTKGIGIQEIGSNACNSQENNSIWLKIKIRTGGTFGFLITPQSNDLVVDFDFWIFGPNVNCNNIGTAVRCSTTNPLNANLSYNTTGMNNIETDVSEGPGSLGNAFIQWMTVNDNDTYYIAIDRPVGESNFAISWTGTATFYQRPVIQNTIALEQCEAATLPANVSVFDLTQNTSRAIGNQTNLQVLYYTTYNEAIVGINAIVNPTQFENTATPQKIYLRLVNTVTGCFVVTDFNLIVDEPIDAVTDFSYVSPVCSKGVNPMPTTNLNFTTTGIFSATPQGLAISPLDGNINLSESQPGVYSITYSVTQNNDNCYTSSQSNFSLEIDNCMIPKGISPNGDNLNDFFNLDKFDVKNLTIFNRYGMKVYHKLNYSNEWNGLSDKGKELPDATYYYLIELNNGEQKTGWVYVNREQK